MDAIRYGTVTGVPKPVTIQTKNEVFIGNVIFDSGSEIHRCYIKKISNEFILAEYLLASLATLNNLHAITPIIINWNGLVCFGSFDEACPNLSTLVNNYNKGIDPTGTIEKLNWFSNWSSLHLAVAFDEFISNPDRNQQNFLVKGKDHVILIDHEGALASHADHATDLNQLLKACSSVINDGDEVGKRRLLNDVNKQIKSLKYSSINHALDLLVGDNLLTIEESTEKHDYLQTRLHNISRFIEMQLDMKQTGFNYNG